MALKAFASLRFTGEALEPSAIGDILCVRPTLSYHKGELFPVGRSRRERVGRTGLWLLSTEGAADPHDLDAHLFYLLQVIFLGYENELDSTKVDKLKEFIANNHIEMRVSLFWHGSSAEPEPRINEEFYSLIHHVGGSVNVDFDREDPVPPLGASEAA